MGYEQDPYHYDPAHLRELYPRLESFFDSIEGVKNEHYLLRELQQGTMGVLKTSRRLTPLLSEALTKDGLTVPPRASFPQLLDLAKKKRKVKKARRKKHSVPIRMFTLEQQQKGVHGKARTSQKGWVSVIQSIPLTESIPLIDFFRANFEKLGYKSTSWTAFQTRFDNWQNTEFAPLYRSGNFNRSYVIGKVNLEAPIHRSATTKQRDFVAKFTAIAKELPPDTPISEVFNQMGITSSSRGRFYDYWHKWVDHGFEPKGKIYQVWGEEEEARLIALGKEFLAKNEVCRAVAKAFAKELEEQGFPRSYHSILRKINELQKANRCPYFSKRE